MKRFIAYLFAILCIGLTFNLSAKDLTGLLKALEVSKQSSVSIDLDKISKEYGYKNFKSFIKDFKKKNKIKRLSVEDATIYFAGYDPDLEIKESKENIDKLHQLILSNQIFRSNTDYFKKKNSNKLKWLAVSVDYKKEMAKITTNLNLKKISPFVWGVSSYAAGAISACEREKVYLKIFGPECILVDISKNKQYLNVITPKEKIEMCKENSLLLFPDLFKIPDLDIKNKRYISYCSSDLFSLAGVAEIDRTIDLMLQEIEKNKYLYAKLPNNISSNIKKIDKTEPSQTQDVAEDEKRQKEEQILAEQKAEEEKKEDEKLKLEEQILAQQKAEEESKKADIRKKKTNQNSNFLGFLSNPTLWLIFGIILISILIYQLKLLQKLKEYLLKWNNKNNKLFKTKKKQKIGINYFSKFDWIIKWAKENKKYAIWISISVILISWIISPILALLYVFAVPYLKDIKKDYIDYKKIPEGLGIVKHPFIIKAYGVAFIPLFAAFIINLALTPNIKDADRAKRYLANTKWEFTDSWQFDATKWITSKTRFVFDEDADNCHSEFKPDPDMTDQAVGSDIKWIVFEEDMIDSIEKKTFVNDFGRDTGNVYFKINSDCFQMNKQRIRTVFLRSSGNLYVRYWHISTGDQVEKKLKKK